MIQHTYGSSLVSIRRMMGLQSPMAIWRKTFTDFNSPRMIWEQYCNGVLKDMEFFSGDTWTIRDTIRVKAPERFRANE